MKSETKAIGAMLKLTRREKRLSQQQLAENLCAPSYLSKIENGEIEASGEMIALLFKALGIEYKREADFLQRASQKINSFHDLVFNFRTKDACALFEKLRRKRAEYVRSPLIIDYYLAELAFYALRGEAQRKKAQSVLESLLQIELLMWEEQLQKWYLYRSFYERTNDPELAMEYLRKSLNLKECGYTCYLLAGLCSHIKDHLNMLAYYQQAEQLFLQNGNFAGIVICKYTSGLAYRTLDKAQEALKCFKSTIKLLSTSETQNEELLPYKFNAFYDIAEIYYDLGSFDEMQKFCLALIQIQNENPENIYSVLPYWLMGKHLLRAGKTTQTEEYLNLAREHAHKVADAEKEIELAYLEILQYILSNPDYLKYPAYLHLLLDLKKLIRDYSSNYTLHIVNKDLIEYYRHNRKYKEALLIIEEK